MFTGELACTACAGRVPAAPGATTCPECGKPLSALYPLGDLDPGVLRKRWSSRPAGMWRYRELLPLYEDEEPVSLGEGGTPLLLLDRSSDRLGLDLLLKDEGRNPTGSFKDRGLAAAVTRAARDGAKELVVPSAGNAAAALSAYAARAGLPATVYIPADTPDGVVRRCRRYGARLERVDGVITDCGRLAARHAEGTGALDLSTLREPYRLQGKKTMMLEIAEKLGWRAPDAIVYPTGGGTGLIASWKVLGELEEIGLLEARTRMYAVQSDGCAPIVRAWNEGRREAEPWSEPRTRAFGLRVPRALGDFLILEALSDSDGGGVAIPDSAMEDGARDLGSVEGVSASIEGGATLAAARRLREDGELRSGETVVLFNTGDMRTY